MCRCLLIFSFFLLTSVSLFAQPVSVDLSLSNNQIVNVNDGEVNANTLAMNQVVRMKVVIGNFVSGVVAPGGHFRLRIGLGNGLVLHPNFNLATAPLSAYFNWTYDLSGAQPQIVGNSIAPLPDGFAEFASFDLKCVNSTTSTLSFNMLVANPVGTSTPMSDPAPANNTCSNTYSITAGAALPVNFTSLSPAKNACEVNVLWRVENQLNLKKYEVELSKDNVVFTKIGEAAAKNEQQYNYSFSLTSALKASTIFVRLKAIDVDGSVRYSKTISLSGECGSKQQLILYPNPVTSETALTVMAKEGVFNGRYKVSVISSNGQLISQKEITMNGNKSFPLSIVGLTGGKYHVNVVSLGDASTTVLDFEKL